MHRTLHIAAFVFAGLGILAVGYSFRNFVVAPSVPATVATPLEEKTAVAPQQPAAEAVTARRPTAAPVASTPTPASGSQSAPATAPAPSASAAKPAAMSMTSVASHATAKDCWVVIDGSVYNVSSFISQHPGGARAIARVCGKDGTATFSSEGAHARTGAAESLAQFYVGSVAN